jgi:hypothetical protein
MSGGHELWSPSGSKHWIPCPPSALLAAGLPERENEKAKEGTRVHDVLYKALALGQDPFPAPWQANGKNMPDVDVVGYARAFLAGLEPGKEMFETKVRLFDRCGGTLDYSRIPQQHNIITVLDYKNGSFDVEAEGNTQMLTYAATFLDLYPHVTHFRLVIFQPNSWANSGEAFKQHVHTRAEVEAHKVKVAEAMAYRGPPKPGPHCRYCPGFTQCPAMSNDTAFMMAAISRMSDPSTFTAADLTRMLRIIRSLGDSREYLESVLRDKVKAGDKPDDVSLKPSIKWWAWNDPVQAAATLFNLHGPKGVKPITVAAAKKLGPQAAAYATVAAHKPEPELKVSY